MADVKLPENYILKNNSFKSIGTNDSKNNFLKCFSFVEFFAYSLFFLGFIFNLAFISLCSYEGSEISNIGIFINGSCSIIGHLVLGAFILSQINIKNNFRSNNFKSEGPICILGAQILFYLISAVSIFYFLWSIVINEDEFSEAVARGFLSNFSNISFGALPHLAEVVDSDSIHFYFSIAMLYMAWFYFGLGKVMILIRKNLAILYSLSSSSSFVVLALTKREQKVARDAIDAEREAERIKSEEACKKVVEDLLLSMIQLPDQNYLMSKYEVTQKLWRIVMGYDPSEFNSLENPVDNISWFDCQKFIRKLNDLSAIKEAGIIFRLPTVDEWIYACRAGAIGDYCKLQDGVELSKETLEEVAWYKDNAEQKTHPVGLKKPNAFGLYDMHGNLWEWTITSDGDYRVVCGGSWSDSAEHCAASCQDLSLPNSHYNNMGFRLCAERRISVKE